MAQTNEMASVTDLEAPALHVSPLSKGRKVETAWLDTRGEPVYAMLSDLRVRFPPSVYNGTGKETKKNVVFDLTTANHQGLSELERRIREAGAYLLGGTAWNSWLSNEDQQPRLKVKVTEATAYYDAQRQAVVCPPDEDWRGMACNARILVKALWVHNKSAGLLAEVTDLQVVEKPKAERVCPFKSWGQ